MNAKIIDSKFYWHGNEEVCEGNLDIYFSNGVVLVLFVAKIDGSVYLSSPYTNEEMCVNLFLKEELITSFFITKTKIKIKENGEFLKKYTSLKYWIFAKARRNERKELKQLLSTI